MTLPAKNRFDPALAIDTAGNKPSQTFRDYVRSTDAILAAILAGQGPKLVQAANDAAAARAGVAVGSFYVNGSTVMQRQS